MAGADDVVKAALKLIFSGSKAVDEAGVPVRYYHGTTKDLPVIKPGTYFTEDPGEGSAYTFWTDLKNAEKHKGKYSVISAPELAGKRLEYFGTISDIDDPKVGEFYATDNGIMRYKGNGTWDVASDVGIDSGSLDMSDYTIGIKSYDNSEAAKQMVDEYEEAVKRVYPGGVGGNVIPAYLNVKNPKEMSPLEGNRFGERLGADPKWVADEIERLKAQGYDSIVTTSDDPFYAMEGKKPPKQYVIFDPTQAKSAIGNTGEYDFTNPDITKSSGGSIRQGYGPGGWVDDVVKMAGKVISGEGEEATKAFRMPRVRPSTDNIHDVGSANFDYYDVVGNKTMPIKDVFGGVDLSMPDQRARVDALKAAMSDPEKGYISRIIVDDEGNVIEGQHRFDAFRELGAPEIPVTMLRDKSRGIDVNAMRSVIQSQGGIHPDQAKQIVDMILEGNPEDYEPPQGFEKWWNAGVGEYNKQRGRIAKGGGGGFLDDALRMAGKAIFGEGEDAAKAGIRAYHGSPNEISEFKSGMGKTAKDIYLTPFKEDASGYGKNVYEVNVSGKVGDFTPENRGPEQIAQLREAYEGGLGDYFESFDDFLDALDSGDMYQRFGNQHAQNDVVSNLLHDLEGRRRYDAVRIPDARVGGGMSESIVTDRPDILSIIRKYGIAGASAMLGYNLMEQLDPKQALAASMADQDYQASRPQRSMGGNNSISGALNVARGLNGVK